MRKLSKNSLIKKALEYIEDKSKDLLDLSVDLVFNPEKIVGGLIQYRGYSKCSFLKSTNSLKRSSYFLEKDKRLCLTAKGRIEIIKNVIKRKKDNKKWRGGWIAIIFDIPESNKRERNFLRKELKWMGFKELQHSVWVTPYNIKEELLTLLKLWHKDFKGDIKILEIKKITEDESIKKRFNL